MESRWVLIYIDITAHFNYLILKLAPAVSSDPTLNFILYIPSASQSPLYITDTNGKYI